MHQFVIHSPYTGSLWTFLLARPPSLPHHLVIFTYYRSKTWTWWYIYCVHQLTLRAIRGLLVRRWITQETLKKKKKRQSRGFGWWKPQTSVAKLALFLPPTKEESLMPRLGINTALSSFFHFAIKIYNKQKKYRLPLCKSRPPSGSHRRLLCFLFSLAFFLSQKSPFIYSPAEFTLCSPPSETVSCSAVHRGPRLSSLPGSPPLFPVFSVTAWPNNQ